MCTAFGSNGSGSGEFSFPRGVAVDGAGNIVVADTNNDRVQIVSLLDGLLVNDTDPENDPLTVSSSGALTSTEGAAVTVNSDGSLTYDPTGAIALQDLGDGDSVDDTFTYTISDGNGGTDTGTVTITVAGVDDGED